MFKVVAETVEDYLDFDPVRRTELIAFDRLMQTSAPRLQRHFHPGTPPGEPGMRFRMIGYGRFQYQASSGALVDWPVVGVALQKNYISAYLSVSNTDGPVLASYASTLNALRTGRNNFSFQRLSELDQPVLKLLIAEVAAIVEHDPANPARYRSGQTAQ